MQNHNTHPSGKSTPTPPLPAFAVISLRHYRAELLALPPSAEFAKLVGLGSALLEAGRKSHE